MFVVNIGEILEDKFKYGNITRRISQCTPPTPPPLYILYVCI